MSAAVAFELGKVPMQSSSRIRQCSSPCTLRSVTPIPNLLYKTVSPTFKWNSCVVSPTLPSPTATMSPAKQKPDKFGYLGTFTCSTPYMHMSNYLGAVDLSCLTRGRLFLG